MTKTIDDFIDAAWNDHGDDPVAVAARLPDGLALLDAAPQKAADFVQLAEHVLVAHLADADALDRCLRSLASLTDPAPDVAESVARAALAAQLLRGEHAVPSELPLEAVVRAHGSAACGQVFRGDIDASRALLRSASQRVGDPAQAAPDALKALAACHHNLAAVLLDAPRTPTGDVLMMEAAMQSHALWSQAGTWLNVERADCMLALCAAAAGDAAQAVASAHSCLALCAAHDADAFERFCGHEALGHALNAAGDREGARAQVAQLLVLLDQVAAPDRAHAEACLSKLAAAIDPS